MVRSPFAHCTALGSIAVGPDSSSSGCGGCFLFYRANPGQLREGTPLNHRPRCLGQVAFGHCWLGSWSPMLTFDMVCPSVCGPLPTPQPPGLGGSDRGPAFKSISCFMYHLFWGEAGHWRGNGHIVAICCLMVADILFALKQMLNCQRTQADRSDAFGY